MADQNARHESEVCARINGYNDSQTSFEKNDEKLVDFKKATQENENNTDIGNNNDFKENRTETGAKKKKKRKKLKERNKNIDLQYQDDSGKEECGDTVEREKRRKHKRKKRKKRELVGESAIARVIDGTERDHERRVQNHLSPGENTRQFPPGGLWLGKHLIQNATKDIEDNHLQNVALEEQNAGHIANHSIHFLANSFSSFPGKGRDNVHVSHTNPNAQHDIKSSNETGHERYVKSQKRLKSKKRFVNLKKTSSKVSVFSSELPPVSSRLELDPTARTERQDKRDGADQTAEETVKERPLGFPEPLKLCKIITKYPLLSFFTITIFHAAIFAITGGLVLSGHDVFPAVFDDLPLYIYNEVRLKELSWRSRTSFPGHINRYVYGISVNTGYRGRIKDTVEVIYEKPGVNILTRDHLFWIKTTEERLFDEPDLQEYFCLLDHNYNCVKPQSLIRLFDGTYSHIDNIFFDKNFDNITQVLYKASVYNETKDYLKLFLGKDSVVTSTGSYTTITRSFFFIGWPLYRLKNRKWGKEEDITNYLADVFKPKIESIRDFYLVERFDVYYLSKMMYEHDLVEQALTDIKLAIGSVLFIFLFMCFQTGTIVVTSLGVLSILSSFLLTNLVYRYAFGFKYFGFFHVIAIFLILGIGADDLFVFYDTWRLTGHTKYPSDAHRLSDCFRKAAKTTFVTSLTTTMAFLVSGLSPLLPVRTFGIFTGFLVAVNYIWVIIYFPSIIIIHHTKTKYLWRKFHRVLLSVCLAERLPKFRQGHTKSPTTSDTSSVSETNSSRELLAGSSKDKKTLIDSPRKYVIPSISRLTSPDYASTPRDNSTVINERDIYRELSVALEEREENEAAKTQLDWEAIKSDTAREEYLMRKRSKPKKMFEERNKIVKFLRNTFFDFMTKRIVKIVMPLIFLGVSIFFIHRATMIEPDTHQLRLFRSNHNYAKATDRHYFSFLRNQDDEYQRLYLIWGILPADISSCDQKSADFCFGEPQYDEKFDMNTDSAQLAFKDLCHRLEKLDPAMADKLHIQRDGITNELKIACFTDDFEIYFQNEVDTNWRLPADTNLTLPVSPEHVDRLMDAFQYIYRWPLPADFTNYFELLISYWLTDGYQLNPTKDYFKYNELFAERRVDGVTKHAYYSDSELYYGTKLQFLAIEINTTLNVYSLGFKEGLPIFQEWENFIGNINAEMPEPLNNGIQVTETLWHWLHVQETLASSAVTGIIVGLLTAWPILMLTTLNFIIGTIAAVTIGLVTACVIGLIPLAGWKLGVLESINLCMVVGLSVDYIVHLAEAYRMSKSPRRLDRVHDMLESIGLSVISGAITTMGAAVFMLFAKIQFFFQFGIFILSTVGISLLFSLLGFTTLLSLCGPEDNTGSITALVSGIIKFCKKRDWRSEEMSNEDTKKTERFKCPCASPSVLIDRVYDCLSYSSNERQEATSRQTKPRVR